MTIELAKEYLDGLINENKLLIYNEDTLIVSIKLMKSGLYLHSLIHLHSIQRSKSEMIWWLSLLNEKILTFKYIVL